MGRDTRRIAAPDNCLSPNSFREQQKIEKIINKKKIRLDGRKKNDVKSLSLQIGLIPSVSGSAYIEYGKTKIICSVNGPRDVLNKSDSSVKGQLFCEFKYAMFSCTERQPYMPTDEEVAIAKSIQNALEPVVLLHKFPKSRLDISIWILENDGGVIGASITCAGVALANAGVEMYDLPIGCTLVHTHSEYLMDPTAKEEMYAKFNKDSAEITIAMMPEYKSQVIFIDSSGCINPAVFSEGMKLLQYTCHQLLMKIKIHIKQHISDMNTVSEDECEKGALNKKISSTIRILQPSKYLSIFLKNSIRPDGRELTDFRPIIVNVNCIESAMGSALVRLGKTLVLCGIKAELTNPLPLEPDKGFFVPNVTLTSLCSNKYVPGPPTEQAQLYSQIIMDLWKTSGFVDPKKLCIVPEKLSWCLFSEMVCLSYDGNALDACVLALMAALKHTKLPEVLVNTEDNEIKVTNNFYDLKIDHLLFSATYAVLKDNTIADPTLEEESLQTSSIMNFFKNEEEINVHCLGPISEKMLFQCIECSKNRYNDIKELLDTMN